MIEKIVSGGQTGVDQAALLAASEFEIEIGGWCPKGGLDEKNGNIIEKYPQMKESTTSNPDERTKLNIRDSDGTLIIVPTLPLPDRIVDGTRLTIDSTDELKKPKLIIRLDDKANAIENVKVWIEENDIRVLNIGGPRESNSPGINQQAYDLFHELFAALSLNSRFVI